MRRWAKTVYLWCAALLVAAAATVVAQSTLANFGVNTTEVQRKLVSSLVNGYAPAYPNRKQFQAGTPAMRAAFAKEALAWLKACTESPAFQEDYRKQREAARPAAPSSQGTADERYAKYLADQRRSLQEMKQNVAKMPPDMQKQMAEAVKTMEAQLERSSKDAQMIAMMKQGLAQQAAADQNVYQQRLADFEKRFPAEPRVLVASRLREFLELSKSVDFDAKLVPAGSGKMKFADPQYERMPERWKLCYRAGRDAVQAARAFATDWLRQLPAK
jgi:flagellar biosynthesis GTPase FlhF